MKFRNGFVSNSSSSSFVLAYDDRKVMTDPEKIVDFIDNNLRKDILFWGSYGEGEDMFELGIDQKNYLLNHKKRFVKYNTGTFIDDVYVDDDSPKGYHVEKEEKPYLTAIAEVYDFHETGLDYERTEADMSDFPEPTDGDWSTYWAEQRKRERALWIEKKKNYIDKEKKYLLERGIDPEHLVVKIVNVDNNNCDPDGSYDSDFAPRYFGLQEYTYYREQGDPELNEEEDEE